MRVNGKSLEAPYETLSALVNALALPQRGIAIARNGEIIPRSQWESTTLEESDELEIVSAAAGG